MFLEQVDLSKNPFWKYILGSFVIIIFSVIGQLPLTYVLIESGSVIHGADPMYMLRNLDKNLQLQIKVKYLLKEMVKQNLGM